jgi:hypothetical protein
MIKRFSALLLSIILLTSFVLAQNNDEEKEDKSPYKSIRITITNIILQSLRVMFGKQQTPEQHGNQYLISMVHIRSDVLLSIQIILMLFMLAQEKITASAVFPGEMEYGALEVTEDFINLQITE